MCICVSVKESEFVICDRGHMLLVSALTFPAQYKTMADCKTRSGEYAKITPQSIEHREKRGPWTLVMP